MAATKFSMVFRYLSGSDTSPVPQDAAGWTESVYETSLSTANRSAFNALCIARARLLPQGTFIIGQRFQQVDPVGSAQTAVVNYPGGVGENFRADIPQMALLLRLRSSGVNNVRSYHVCAIPDAQVSLGQYRPVDTFRVLMGLFLDQLNGWKFRGADLAQAKAPVLSVTALGVVTFGSDLVLAVNDQLKILNAIDTNGNRVGGIFRVNAATSLRSVTLGNWKGGVTTEGTGQKYIPIYPTIVGARESISRIVTRKVGRPSGGYRGRRSRRRS